MSLAGGKLVLVLEVLKEIKHSLLCIIIPELQKVFNLPLCKISSFQIFLKIMLVMSFKICFLFLVPADLALI